MDQLKKYFETLKTKDIFCWGSGKHFRSVTRSFLRKSGLMDNLKGFVDVPGTGDVPYGEKSYDRVSRDVLAMMDKEKTLILIAVTGYEEIMNQIRQNPGLSSFEAVPSIFLESLYEDMLLLSADKPEPHYRRLDKPAIPKIIHGIWFSGDPMPKLYRECLDSWKRYCPDYEIKIWDLEMYGASDCLFFNQAICHKNWSFASDYARADILYKYGGIYMDLDVEVLRPIDDLLYNDVYMGFESLDRIECGSGMGARKGHPFMREICASYEERPYLKPDGTWDNSTCPVRYTKVIEKHGLKKNGGFQFVEDITVYPFEMLTGKSFDTGICYKTEHSYTLHHHNGSWVPDGAHNAMSKRHERMLEFLDLKGIKV